MWQTKEWGGAVKDARGPYQPPNGAVKLFELLGHFGTGNLFATKWVHIKHYGLQNWCTQLLVRFRVFFEFNKSGNHQNGV